mmetsp:Transcript_19282/g.43913  ORF Transcript_19282/g.43913 Transcript_19282/m.43913 type:complete len:611 (+) Transcript_19282:1926-3758(+)
MIDVEFENVPFPSSLEHTTSCIEIEVDVTRKLKIESKNRSNTRLNTINSQRVNEPESRFVQNEVNAVDNILIDGSSVKTEEGFKTNVGNDNVNNVINDLKMFTSGSQFRSDGDNTPNEVTGFGCNQLNMKAIPKSYDEFVHVETESKDTSSPTAAEVLDFLKKNFQSNSNFKEQKRSGSGEDKNPDQFSCNTERNQSVNYSNINSPKEKVEVAPSKDPGLSELFSINTQELKKSGTLLQHAYPPDVQVYEECTPDTINEKIIENDNGPVDICNNLLPYIESLEHEIPLQTDIMNVTNFLRDLQKDFTNSSSTIHNSNKIGQLEKGESSVNSPLHRNKDSLQYSHSLLINPKVDNFKQILVGKNIEENSKVKTETLMSLDQNHTHTDHIKLNSNLQSTVHQSSYISKDQEKSAKLHELLPNVEENIFEQTFLSVRNELKRTETVLKNVFSFKSEGPNDLESVCVQSDDNNKVQKKESFPPSKLILIQNELKQTETVIRKVFSKNDETNTNEGSICESSYLATGEEKHVSQLLFRNEAAKVETEVSTAVLNTDSNAAEDPNDQLDFTAGKGDPPISQLTATSNISLSTLPKVKSNVICAQMKKKNYSEAEKK